MQHEQARGRGQPRPSRRPAARRPRRAQSRAGRRRRRAPRCPRHARHHVERHARGGDGEGLGDDGVDGQRVARDQAGDRSPAVASATSSRRRRPGADRGPDLGTVGDQRQHRLGYVGVGDDQRGGGQRVARPHGEQSGVAGAAAHEGDPPRRGGGRCSVHLLSELQRTSSGSTWGRATRQIEQLRGERRTELLGVVQVSGGRRAQQRTVGRADHRAQEHATIRRRHRRRQVGHHVGQAPPTGALQPASRAASTARSAVTAARVHSSSSTARAARRGRGRPRGTRSASAPCAGAGSICSGVEQLGRLVDAAQPAQPGRGDDHGVELAGGDLARSRVSTLPRIGTTSRPRPRASSWATRRGDPVPTRAPAGSSPSTRPSRATSASRGSSRGGTAARTSRGSGAVGRSL